MWRKLGNCYCQLQQDSTEHLDRSHLGLMAYYNDVRIKTIFMTLKLRWD